MKILAIDFGLKRIGLAISDDLKIMALPIGRVDFGKSMKDAINNLLTFLENRLSEIELIVVGLPLHLSGKDSPMSLKAREFAEKLSQNIENIEIKLFDERMTTSLIDREFKSLNINRKKRAQIIDTASACKLLQDYLDLKK